MFLLFFASNCNLNIEVTEAKTHPHGTNRDSPVYIDDNDECSGRRVGEHFS